MNSTRARTVRLAAAAVALCIGVVGADSSHTQREQRPVPLGSSGGNIENIDSGWCCGGTLGALVEDASGNKYILSNNHVLARFNRASAGENVIQPGLIEVGCQQRQGDVVADFTDYVRIKRSGNVVDAAIARIRMGEVDESGDILDIGTLSTDTLDASPGLLVKKSGRTTGLTSGYVSSVDVSVNVGYTTRCGLPNADFIARFNGQIRIIGNSGSFSRPGDSGSVIVEDVANQPRAVGLLFAGSSSSTVANPIDDVLAAFGVTMVGESTVDPPATGSVSGVVSEAGGGPIADALVQVDSGQSDMTDGSGAYLIADVPIGERTVTASKSGYQNEPPLNVTVTDGGMSTADFTLDPIPTPTGVEVGCITYETSGGRDGSKHLRITPRIVDDQGAPVAGVGITVDVSGPNATIATVITDASGHAVVEVKNAANGTYSTDVTNVDGFGDPTEPVNLFDKGGSSPSSFGACAGSQAASRGQLTQADPAAIRRAIAAKRRHEASLFASSNQVVGTGVGLAGGEPAIEVYLATGDPRGRSQLPGHIEGFRVEPIVTGLFTAGLECQRMD